MILSVRQSFRCKAISASDLLFLRKRSPVVPIQQNCLLLLSTLKKPADQPLHVSTSVENLKFKCETAAMSTAMKKKKNIAGVYLATRWAVPNLVYHQLNALALTPYPTLSIMTLNLSSGKGGYAARASIRGFFLTSIWPRSTIKVDNKSDRVIKISIQQEIEEEEEEEHFICEDLEAGVKKDIKIGEIKRCVELKLLATVIIRAGSEKIVVMTPQEFIKYEKLVFKVDANEKLVWEWTKKALQW